MIISFSVENWMSFRDRVTFSMIATREKQHSDRISILKKYDTRVLPIAVIYGGNAAGKTNFFKALNFARNLIVMGTSPGSYLALDPFLLDDESFGKPSRFEFELLIDEVIYEFSFAANHKEILEEKLVVINSNSEKVLYKRHGKKIVFNDSLKEDQFLQFAFQGTRYNQLFLTNSVSQNVNTFIPVYNWFKDTLDLVAPDSRFAPFEQFIDEDNPLYATMNDILPKLDTGIARLGGEEIRFENVPLPEFIKMNLKEQVQEGEPVQFMDNVNNDRFILTRKGGNLIAKKLVTYHTRTDGTEIKFDIHQESDGSKRIIDLLPAFLELSEAKSDRVFIIDEVDRSLHTLLTRKLIEAYLARCSNNSRTQLLLTTHDVLLMDQKILRRDEMWVAERRISGVSTLMSFSEYKDVRYDKDIRKSYLQGRLGGIPKILLSQGLADSDDMKSVEEK